MRTRIHSRERREFLYKLCIVNVLNKVKQPTQRTNFRTMHTMWERTERCNNMWIPVCDDTQVRRRTRGNCTIQKKKREASSWMCVPHTCACTCVRVSESNSKHERTEEYTRKRVSFKRVQATTCAQEIRTCRSDHLNVSLSGFINSRVRTCSCISSYRFLI